MTQLVEFNSSGIAVFAGTRVPVANVTASLDAGLTFERVQDSWPFLTLALVDEARRFLTEFGTAMPPRFAELFPEAVLISRKVVPPRGED